jgi:hypothetical protein
MFTQITEIGFSNLQMLVSGSKIKLTRYEMGLLTDPPDLSDTEYTAGVYDLVFKGTQLDYLGDDLTIRLTGMTNNVVMPDSIKTRFTATYNSVDVQQLTQTAIDDTQTILKMFVPQDVTYFKVNAVMLYATVDGLNEFPFLISYSLTVNPKFSTETNKYGTRYFYMLQLNLEDRDTRFDFSAIALETPDFPVIADHYDLDPPYRNTWQQAIVNQHINIETPNRVLIVNSEEQFFGIMMREFVPPTISNVLLQGNQVTLEGDDLVIKANNNVDIILT